MDAVRSFKNPMRTFRIPNSRRQYESHSKVFSDTDSTVSSKCKHLTVKSTDLNTAGDSAKYYSAFSKVTVSEMVDSPSDATHTRNVMWLKGLFDDIFVSRSLLIVFIGLLLLSTLVFFPISEDRQKSHMYELEGKDNLYKREDELRQWAVSLVGDLEKKMSMLSTKDREQEEETRQTALAITNLKNSAIELFQKYQETKAGLENVLSKVQQLEQEVAEQKAELNWFKTMITDPEGKSFWKRLSHLVNYLPSLPIHI